MTNHRHIYQTANAWAQNNSYHRDLRDLSIISTFSRDKQTETYVDDLLKDKSITKQYFCCHFTVYIHANCAICIILFVNNLRIMYV